MGDPEMGADGPESQENNKLKCLGCWSEFTGTNSDTDSQDETFERECQSPTDPSIVHEEGGASPCHDFREKRWDIAV